MSAHSPARPSRLLWPACGLLLALLVSLALPGQRIQLGASQLQGLVGSYTRHGNWLIQATYAGTCTVTTTASGVEGSQSGSVYANIGGYFYPVTNGTYNLSALTNPAPTTDTGGISTSLNTHAMVGIQGKGSQAMSLSTDQAKIHLQLTWLPENGDANFDPPPSTIAVFYRIGVTATSNAVAPGNGDNAQANVSLSCGEANTAAHSTADGPDGNDPDQGRGGTNFSPLLGARFVERKLSAGSSTSLDFNVNINSSVSGYSIYSDHRHQAETDTNIKMDFCVAGFDMTRFGTSLNPLGGGNNNDGSDPTYTRWLPLAFSPHITSQPFRYQAGVLPGPWGNINCMYSPALRQEPDNPNLDIDGAALESQPSPDANGNINSPAAPFTLIPGSFTPQYSIIDANGDRLLFDAGWNAFRDVHSTLVNQGNGNYQLTNAGPPGAMRQKGDYTYTFQKTNTYTQPLTTRLISIEDNLGNKQTLTWGSGLTVADNSSGRQLVFNMGGNGYFGSVDAPENGGGIHTHTALTWDTSGHCTAVNVYAGGTNLLLHSDVFGYGGPNGDSVTSSQQGVSVTSFAYASDPQAPDAFGLAAPRLASATYGSSGDTSSSDDGGSVAGTVSYTYGPTQHGYNWWGISAHTNTTTDARGNTFWDIFELGGQVYGDLTGLRSQGPNFAGSAAYNKVRTTYTPNIDQPQQISFYDQLYFAQISAQAWVSNLDLLGNLTSFVDPLNHTWQFGYTADGKHLASGSDPTGIGFGMAYGERGNGTSLLTSVSDPAMGTTLIDYNSFGQPTVVTSPSATGTEQTQYSYDATTGDLTQILGPTGDAMRITGYDALGDPLGAAVYPDTGNPATSTHPLITSVTYDAAQMPVNIVSPNGVNLQTTFNNGVMSLFQLQNQGQTLAQMTLAHDTRGRLYQASDTVGALAGYRYDKNSNVTRILDGNGNITQFMYGSNDELTGLTWPDGHGTSAAYDAAGRVRQTTDERGIVCNYVYDNAHRLTDVQWPAYASENTHYTYDDAGRLLTVQDASGSRTYVYDLSGRLHQVTTVYSSLPVGSNSYVISYTYYGDGSISGVTSPIGTTQYQYNATGELSQLTAPWGDVTTWSYDHVGSLTGQTTVTAGGQTLTTAYTWGVSGLAGDPSLAACHLRQIQNSANGQTWTYTLMHSLLGQLLRQDDATSQANVNGYEQFSYDGRGRLSSETLHWQANAMTAYNLSSSYGFDTANNVKPTGGNWTSNSSNQLTSAPFVSSAPGLSGASGLSYDVAGNTQTLSGGTFSYNAWGDVSDIALPGGTAVHYAYDSSGRRIAKTVGSIKTYYLYDGRMLLAELDGTGQITRRYAWGASGLISDRSGSGASGQTRLYGFDGMGNTRVVLDGGNGAVLWQGAWSAWGQPNGASGPPCAYGYHGQTGAYLDGETGLLRMGARLYAPATGRWLTRDPSGWSNGANLYGFCMGDPVDFFDATGCDGTPYYKAVHGLWEDIERWGNHEDGLPISSGIPASWLGAKAAFKNWGTAAGSTKVSAAATWGAGLNAGMHFAGAALVTYANARLGIPTRVKSDGCFVAGTLVWVAWQDSKGVWYVSTKPIEQVKQGEIVLARSESTGQVEYKKVLSTSVREVDMVLAVTLADAKTGQAVETITATREHPFAIEGKGFVPAGGLAIGNSIVTRAGPALVVKDIKWLRRAEGYSVYNFVVDDHHTYFVGNAHGGVWVHNADCPNPYGMRGGPKVKAQEKEIADRLRQDGWDITHGADAGKQEPIFDPNYIPTGKRGRRRGTLYPDITATKDGNTLRIQTVTTKPDGWPDKREWENAMKIQDRRPGDGLILIPKRR